MKRFLTAAVAASALLAAGAAAHAEGINQRQAQLEQHINQGIRNGGITQAEAIQLRAEFRSLQMLENSYRKSGGNVSTAERNDLMRRFDILDAKIYLSRTDRDYAMRWQNINARQAELERRIQVGIRNRQLNMAEAARLRVEFQAIARLEATYRASGGYLSLAERRDLDKRMDNLTHRIRNLRTN